MYKPVEIKKIKVKEDIKDKNWKNLSSSEKDELLFEIAKRLGFISSDKNYK